MHLKCDCRRDERLGTVTLKAGKTSKHPDGSWGKINLADLLSSGRHQISYHFRSDFDGVVQAVSVFHYEDVKPAERRKSYRIFHKTLIKKTPQRTMGLTDKVFSFSKGGRFCVASSSQ